MFIRRSLRRVVTREELWNGNRDYWSNLCSCSPEKSIIAWSATRHRVYRQRYVEAEQDPRWARLRFVRLRTQRDADAFLARVGARGAGEVVGRSNNMDLELGGKIVLITGGTDGLGLALATELASEGAAVAVCGRDEERLQAAQGVIEAVGGDVLAQCADVSTPADLAAFVDAAVARWGRIDAVVHNAGRASAGAIESIDDTIWESDIELKLMAAVRLTRLALPYLRASHGAMLFTLAMAAKAPGASSEPSSVTRAAGMALMKALSKELAPDGIRVNAILIGLIESGQWSRIAEGSGMTMRAFYDRFAEDAGIPLGRFGRAAEFADLGCFLVSTRASYLTGTAINLDGGLSPSV